MVVVAARAVVVAAVLGLVAVAFDQIGLHAQRVLVVVAALRRDDVVELAAALVRVVFLCGVPSGAFDTSWASDRYAIRTRNLRL